MSELDLALRMLTWLAANPYTTVDEVSQRLGVSKARVLRLLEAVRWAGVGQMYGELIDIDIHDDGDITVHNTQGLDRPLHLTTPEASAIMSGLA